MRAFFFLEVSVDGGTTFANYVTQTGGTGTPNQAVLSAVASNVTACAHFGVRCRAVVLDDGILRRWRWKCTTSGAAFVVPVITVAKPSFWFTRCFPTPIEQTLFGVGDLTMENIMARLIRLEGKEPSGDEGKEEERPPTRVPSLKKVVRIEPDPDDPPIEELPRAIAPGVLVRARSGASRLSLSSASPPMLR